MVRQWRYPKIRIRSSPPYHFSGGVPSASGAPQPLAGEKVLVRCIFVYVYFPHLLGGFLHILTYTCNYMLWHLALREYNLSIPNMVSEPVPVLCF
jgi:hypothetical protein